MQVYSGFPQLLRTCNLTRRKALGGSFCEENKESPADGGRHLQCSLPPAIVPPQPEGTGSLPEPLPTAALSALPERTGKRFQRWPSPCLPSSGCPRWRAERCSGIRPSLSCRDMLTTWPSSLAASCMRTPYLHAEGLSYHAVHIVGELPQESFCVTLVHSLKDKTRSWLC